MKSSSHNLQQLDQALKELTSTAVGRRVFLQSLPLLVAATACATKGKKERLREGDNTGQATELTVNDEIKMTQEVLPKMRKDYPAVTDKTLQEYISRLGNKIVQANGLHKNPYEYSFTLVDVNYVNAFALPAGTVMVTTPLLAMAETEAEIAGVIGHEIGHIKARHTAERMDAAQKSQKKTWLYGALGGVVGGAVGFGLGTLLCRKNDKSCLQRAALYGAAAGVGGTLLVQKYAFFANSREDEMEADRIGFKTAVAAGYHKDHVGSFYTKLLEMEKKLKGDQKNAMLASLTDAMNTHPPSQERVGQMQEMAESQSAKPSMIISTSEFDKMRARAQKLAPQKTKASS